MRHAWANTALLVLLVVELVTGLLGLIGAGLAPSAVLWAHAAGGDAVLALLVWKGRIVLDVLRRRRLDAARVGALGLLVLLLLVLGSAEAWVLGGPRAVGPISLLNVHEWLAVALVSLLGLHVAARRWVLRVRRARGRAAFLRLAGVAAAGLGLVALERSVERALGLVGSRRRLTGSYPVGPPGSPFPAVSWTTDDPVPLDRATWRLVVDGAVRRPLRLSFDEVAALADTTRSAVLDCTGGFATEQHWRGVPLAALLARAQPTEAGRSVSVRAVTGYGRRFPLADADRLLLALAVGAAPLDHGHGAPARLVAPGRRGYDWVKWVVHVRVESSSPLLQPPLPL